MKFKEVEHKLKEGMKIKVIESEAGCHKGKIESLEKFFDGWAGGGYSGHVFYPNDVVELLDEAEGTKFTVGQRVRVITDRPRFGWGEVSKGDIGVVRREPDGDGDLKVDFPSQPNWTARVGELEPVEESLEVKLEGQVDFKPYFETWNMGFDEGQVVRKIDQYIYQQYKAQEPKKGIIMSAVSTIKNAALKVKDPGEYELRKAELHDSCGDLTSEGKNVLWQILDEKFKTELVDAAKAINAEADRE
jgi:hypothetical protein